MSERRKPSQGVSAVVMSYEEYLKDIHEMAFNLFQQMQDDLGREKALDILRRAGERHGREIGLRQKSSFGNVRSFEDFKTLWRKVIASPLWIGTQDSEIVEEGERHLSMRVTRCLWAETFKALGDLETGYLMCCNCDHAMLRAHSPNIVLVRTRTIMQGDDHCNHCFRWED